MGGARCSATQNNPQGVWAHHPVHPVRSEPAPSGEWLGPGVLPLWPVRFHLCQVDHENGPGGFIPPLHNIQDEREGEPHMP